MESVRLYRSDGTKAGTGVVRPRAAACGIYFAAGPGGASHGWELVDTEPWSSDGTTAGTVEFVDVNPTGSSGPRDLVRLGDTILFTATDGVHGRELWRLDP